MRVMYDNILVSPLDIDENITFKVKGKDVSVARPKQYEDKPEWGVVIGAGRGRVLESGELLPSEIKVGDTILFQKYSAQKFRHQGEDYLIIREDDIHLVI